MRHLGGRLRRLARGLGGIADPVVLMYHRVADVTLDPWGLAVSPGHFAAQMRELKRLRRPVPLDEMVAQLLAGKPVQGTVAVTFDDAYRDVLMNAKPILEELGIPATVFVVSGELGNERGFWWDRLAAAVFTGDPPANLPAFSFLDETTLRALAADWRGGGHAALHLSLWRAVRTLLPDGREAAIDEVAAAFGVGRSEAAPVMTADDLSSLVDGGWISLGAHTVSHPSLPSLSLQDQREEIGNSRYVLERLTGAPIRALAYPFGDYDARSLEAARDLGFDYAVSVEAGSVSDVAARFRLPRHDVKDWTGAEFRKRLRWWI